MRQPAPGRGLSGKILLLAVAVVLLCEVLIFIPSIARFRLVFLNERIGAAYLATIALDREGASRLDRMTKMLLLREAGAYSITLHRPSAELMLGRGRPYDVTFDLRTSTPMHLIWDALETLVTGGTRTLRVIGMPHPQDESVLVDIILPEDRLWREMVDYSFRILTLTIVLSIGVALCLFVSLQRMIVQPLRIITTELAVFRERPEDASADTAVSRREDEIGVVERELAQMRSRLRRALVEKTRLAALGSALGRMSHDLRNLLATAVLVSDRLETSPDPEVRRIASRLIETLDRAIRLCAETLNYARSRPEPSKPRPVRLAELIDRVRNSLADRPEPVRWQVDVDPRLELVIDPDQLHRVLLNLARNAHEAMGEEGGDLTIRAEADGSRLLLTVEDTGPGIPERIRERLFEPFAGSGKPEGTGLGLAICRELMRAHGGEIRLKETSQQGTIFELYLPARALRRDATQRSRVMSVTRLGFLLLPMLAACSWQGPSLAGYKGLQYKVISFYDTYAMEENATCPQPRMTAVTRTRVIDETPERVVMNIKYHYRDEGQTSDSLFFPGGTIYRCDDFAERTFTFTKNSAGGLDVASMTGPQRR